MCSVKVRREALFCWNCNADQSKFGPTEGESPRTVLGRSTAEDRRGTTDETGKTSGSQGTYGRPNVKHERVLSLDTFMKVKSIEQRAGCDYRSKPKKAKVENDDEEVTINMGIKQ